MDFESNRFDKQFLVGTITIVIEMLFLGYSLSTLSRSLFQLREKRNICERAGWRGKGGQNVVAFRRMKAVRLCILILPLSVRP